jgi:ABC-type multidrug transport system fused ATPase/permease subunit
MEVIADKVKFLDALHVDKSILQYAGHVGRNILISVLIVAIVLAIGYSHNILLFMAIAVVVIIVFLKSYSGSRSNRKRSLYTALDVLGETVAEIVFIPPVAVSVHNKAMEEHESAFIKREMREWGYSDEYITRFIAENTSRNVDNLTLQITDLKERLNNKFRTKDPNVRVAASEINLKDLCRKSYDLCNQLYQRSGVVDSGKEKYLIRLKEQMKV